MKILMLNYEFPPLGGGGGVAAYKLAKGYVNAGHEVDYVTSWFKGLKINEIVDGINVHRIKVINRNSLSTASPISLLTYPVMAYKETSRLCNKQHYDFINTHFVIPSGILGLIISKKYCIKNILSLHGGDIFDPTKICSPHRNPLLRIVVRYLINNSHVVVAQSKNTRDNAIVYYKPNIPIHIIPLPHEPYIFKKVKRSQLGLDENLRYTISIGRLVKRKGFDFLIKSISLCDKYYHSLIIGDGPEMKNLIKLTEVFNVEGRVHFLGHVTDEKKFQYLNCADVFVLSSRHEGFGIVLQEATQVGIPIVATNNGGQTDIINHGKNGFLVNFGNTAQMKRSIEKSFSKKQAFKKVNEILVKKYFTNTVVENYIKLVND